MTARLPDTSVFGSSRFDPGAIALPPDVLHEAQATAAWGLDDAGEEASNVGSSLAAIDFANEKFDFLKADSLWNVGKAETHTEFGADTGYQDFPDRYEQALRTRRDSIAGTITHPRARENFTFKSEAEIARSRQAAQDHARKLEADASLLWLDRQQEKLIAATSSKSDLAERAQDITSHRALIRSFGEKGWLTEQEVAERAVAFRNTYAVALAKTQARAGNVDQVIAQLEAAQQRNRQSSERQTPDAATQQGALSVFDAIDAPERDRLLKHMHEVRDGQRRETAMAALKASGERKAEYERRMRDASIGKGELPGHDKIEDDAALDAAHKDEALRRWNIASGDRLSFKAAFDRFDRNQPFDPDDHDDRKNADRIFQSMGGDDAALTAVVERTGIFPDSAAIKMRGDLISDDPERVAAAMTRATKAIAINPDAMSNVEGGAELETSAGQFRSLVDEFGLAPQEAADRMVREQTSESRGTEAPPAFEGTFKESAPARRSYNGFAQNVPIFIDLVKSPEGRNTLRDALAKYPAHFIQGVIDLLKLPGDTWRGEADLSTRGGMDRAIALGVLVTLLGLRKLPRTGKTSGPAPRGTTPGPRGDRSPDGQTGDKPIAGRPELEDLFAAARKFAREAEGNAYPDEPGEDKKSSGLSSEPAATAPADGETGQAGEPAAGDPERLPAIRQKLREMFERAKQGGPLPSMRVEIGPVNPEVAVRIENVLRRAGVELDGEVKDDLHDVDIQEARHTYNNHGSEVRESHRGQMAITAEDWARIPDITDSPDLITYDGLTKEGLPALIFWKRVNGTMYYVVQVRAGKGTLSAKTMWKYKTNKRLEKMLRDAAER